MIQYSPVLVSGGAGYVGSHVVLALSDAGYRPVILDNLSTPYPNAMPPNVELVEGDAGDSDALRTLIARYHIKAAIHLAGVASIDGASVDIQKNADMNEVFFHACAEGGVSRLVLTSSAAVYGMGQGPVSAYGDVKLAAEHTLSQVFSRCGRRYAVLRCFNVAGADPQQRAGPRQGQGLVQTACEAALGLRECVTVFGTDWETKDGTCVRDYVHVCDVAKTHVSALRALEQGVACVTVDCGTGVGHSVYEVIAAVRRVSGSSFDVCSEPRRRGDVASSIASRDRIRRAPDWRAQSSRLDDVAASTLAWIKSRWNGCSS